MNDHEFMAQIIAEICDYAVKNKMEPNDTLRTVAENIDMMLEISNFNNWQPTNVAAQEEKKSGWISVEDELPETEYDYFGHSTGESHDVLIYMENENYSESRILVGKYSMLFSYWPQEDRADGWRVTHWMELPEPPEKIS